MRTLLVIWVTTFVTTFAVLFYIDKVINENIAQATGDTSAPALEATQAGEEQTFYYPTINPQLTITVKQLQGGQ